MLGLFNDTEHTMTFSRLQDYVRTGADKAEILVSLQNEDEAAYKPEVFGTSVTFQRIIWSSGQSSFSLLDLGGSIVKTNVTRRQGSRTRRSSKSSGSVHVPFCCRGRPGNSLR